VAGIPDALWLVRHAESQGNLADAKATEAGAARLELDVRDPDTPLSGTGSRQAEALGAWLGALPVDERPGAVLSSPYARAADTATTAVQVSGLTVPVCFDERLRERDLGVFDRMTRAGIRAEYPEEAQRRDQLGKFYYRPPGGESWADVALRVRSLLATEALRHDGDRLLLVAHQAVIMVFRYVLEELTEQQLLDIDRAEQIANTSVTRYETGADGRLELVAFNEVAHLVTEAQHVTEEPDAVQQS
jgi:broad specificity phosphatase PhoE